jgi:type II secretory pathway pseudopilin PulG
MISRRREGFVLLEAVVALAILGVASIVLLQVRAQQIRVATQARELLTAQALAEDRISAVRMLDYQLLADPPDSLMSGIFPPPFQEFSWSTQVALMEDEYDLFGVEVEVLGPAERFPLRTLIHRPRPVLAGGDAAGGGTARGAFGGRGQGARGGERGAQAGRQGGRGGEQAGRGPGGRPGGGQGSGAGPPGGVGRPGGGP